MIKTNPMLLCDTYKTCHKMMYPAGLTKLVSYWVPRKSMLKENPKMVFFGLQAFVKEFLVDYFNEEFFGKDWDELISTYKKYMDVQLGENNYDLKGLRELYDLGYLPLEIRGMPEGTTVNMGVPVIELTNTDDRFAWLVQWVECIMQAELWKICNHATLGQQYLRLAEEFYGRTTDGADPRMACSDFGFRGMSCTDEACRASAAWLLSFNKTSTIPALPWLDYYYNANVSKNKIGVGAVSTEHSVMAANYALDGDEITFVKRMLTELYPNTSFSMVSDTYDYWNMVNNIIPACKDEILKHNGKLLVRPDSGDVFNNAINTIEKLWETFGGTVNKKGFKVLNPHIGIIYGEGCTLFKVRKIWEELERRGFAANNIAFGVGAFCFSAFFDNERLVVNTRDTYGCAMKATFGVIDGKPIPIYKDPKTDTDNLKKSHRGCCKVVEGPEGFICIDGFNNWVDDKDTLLRTMFKNGKIIVEEDFNTIRNRI